MSVAASSEDDSTNFGGGLNYGFLSVFTVVIIDLSKVANFKPKSTLVLGVQRESVPAIIQK